MAKVRARKETGTLYLDFNFQGVRCREQTALLDTPANKKKAEELLSRIQAKIVLGQFDYAEVFPHSKNALRFSDMNSENPVLKERLKLSNNKKEDVPIFSDFIGQWFTLEAGVWVWKSKFHQ